METYQPQFRQADADRNGVTRRNPSGKLILKLINENRPGLDGNEFVRASNFILDTQPETDKVRGTN
jgi:hypothetical protein